MKNHTVSICLQGFGLSQLREGASSHSLRSILCVLTLLFYHTYVSLILGRKHFNVFLRGVSVLVEKPQLHHLNLASNVQPQRPK